MAWSYLVVQPNSQGEVQKSIITPFELAALWAVVEMRTEKLKLKCVHGQYRELSRCQIIEVIAAITFSVGSYVGYCVGFVLNKGSKVLANQK